MKYEIQVNVIIDCTLESPNEYRAKEIVEKGIRTLESYTDLTAEVIDIDFISTRESEGVVDLWEYRKNRET